MAIEHSENWFLRKHDSGEIFGPVPFEKIREWADSAQVNPQDMLSIDQVIWTKAPMIPEMEMDWLIVVGENLLYGPTTAEALLEFEKLGEINPATALINCNTGQSSTLGETPFYQASLVDPLSGNKLPRVPCWPRFSSPPKAEVFASIFNSASVSSRMRFSTRVASSWLPRKPSSALKAKSGNWKTAFAIIAVSAGVELLRRELPQFRGCQGWVLTAILGRAPPGSPTAC